MIYPIPPSENDDPDLVALNAQLQKATDIFNHTLIHAALLGF